MVPLTRRLGVLACPLAFLVACATPPPKQASDYDDSPPSTSTSHSSSSSSSSDSEEKDTNGPVGSAGSGASDSPATAPASPAPGGPGDSASANAGPSLPANLGPGWDRELTQKELARAARSVKANCGSASDEEGKKTGPWGKTQVSVRLHHKGHTKEPKASGEFAGTPVGHCIERAFTDLQFPPWQGRDLTIEYDIEVVKPQ